MKVWNTWNSEKELDKLDRNSLSSFGEAWDMSPRLTMAIQDGGHVTRRSVVFLFLHFYFLKKRFSYNPGHYNMSFFVLNSFLSLFSVMVPWNIFVCGLNHSEVSVLSFKRIKDRRCLLQVAVVFVAASVRCGLQQCSLLCHRMRVLGGDDACCWGLLFYCWWTFFGLDRQNWQMWEQIYY